MYFPFYIAKRYLFSKKSHNVINIISAISMAGIGVGSLALIIVLSAFNGLEDLVEKLYSSFDPDIEITARKGKTFPVNDLPVEQIKNMEGVVYFNETLEETALLKYKGKQAIATVKGVDEDFEQMSGLDSMVVEGDFVMKDSKGLNYAVLGYGIAYSLSVYVRDNQFEPIKIYAADRTASFSYAQPQRAFKKRLIKASGIFTLNPDFDNQYVLVPLDYARELFEHQGEVSAVEVGLKKGADAMAIKSKIQQLAGNDYEVKTRYELNELIFKTNKTEKWITYLILTFILIVAAFNLIGSLTMLIIDKKQDIMILRSMGADKSTIRKIFLTEGVLIAAIGGICGLVLGGALCWGQLHFGFVKLDGIIVDQYPVKLEVLDFLAIFATVVVIGLMASYLPVKYVVRRYC